MPFLILEASNELNPVGIDPQRLSSIKINAVFFSVGRTLLRVELEIHNGIVLIPKRGVKCFFGVPVVAPF